MAPFTRVLVANRGEIALRIVRACHEEGLESVAVYSAAARLSPHVRAAHRAVPIGAAPAAESYLDIAKLLEAARATDCQAVHPGYGFLSERAPFAEAVTQAGLTFIGPPATAIRAMGDKTEARRRMQAAGVPIAPGERECSIQRRHQKLIEEAPSVAVTPALRRRLNEAATAAAGSVGYLGAGTIEFLLAPTGEFYFLEMNTRLQVEHPVTELVYGVDIVREQLRVAQGQPLRVHSGALQPRGHAIECRITAEDPFNDFLPATGMIRYLQAPSGPGVRWDGGVEAGNEVTLFYDPLLAKLIVWGDTRAAALPRMRRALRELVIVGIPSSQAFHLRVLADPDFQRGDFDITYLERAGSRLLATGAPPELTPPLAVVAALLAEEQRAAAQSQPPPARPPDRQSAWTLAVRREALGG